MGFDTLYAFSLLDPTSSSVFEDGDTGRCFRIVIPAAALLGTAGFVRALCYPPESTGSSYSITSAFVGLQATSGDAWDLDPTTVQPLTQCGRTRIEVTGSSVYTDPAPLDVDGTRAIAVSFYFTFDDGYVGGESYFGVDNLGVLPDSIEAYRWESLDYSGVANVSESPDTDDEVAVFAREIEGTFDDFVHGYINPPADLVSSAATNDLPAGTWWILFSAIGCDGYFSPYVFTYGGGGYTTRQHLGTPTFVGTAENIRVRFQVISGQTYTITHAYIGLQATSGDAYDIDPATLVRLTQNGNTTLAISGTDFRSDRVSLEIDGTRAVIVSFYGTDGQTYPGLADISSNIVFFYEETGVNEAGTANVTGYSQQSGSCLVVHSIEGTDELITTGIISPPLHQVAAAGIVDANFLSIVPPAEVIESSGNSNLPAREGAGVISGLLPTVAAAGDSTFAIGLLTSAVEEIVASGSSEIPPVVCTGVVDGLLPTISAISYSNRGRVVLGAVVAATGETSIGAWGVIREPIARVFGEGVGNSLADAAISPSKDEVAGSATTTLLGRGNIIDRKHRVVATVDNLATLVGVGRLRPQRDVVAATASLATVANGTITQYVDTIVASGGPFAVGNATVRPPLSRVAATCFSGIGILSFQRNSALSPQQVTPALTSILQFRRDNG